MKGMARSKLHWDSGRPSPLESFMPSMSARESVPIQQKHFGDKS